MVVSFQDAFIAGLAVPSARWLECFADRTESPFVGRVEVHVVSLRNRQENALCARVLQHHKEPISDDI